jgi:hypothetical protein
VIDGKKKRGNAFPKNFDLLQPWYHNHQRSYKVPGFNLWIGTAMHDGVPFLFRNQITGQQAILCLHPKAGSTNFKFLLRYALMKIQDANTNLKDILAESPHSRHTSRVGEIRNAFLTAKIPRIMIVRNPYIRLLSGYLDTIVSRKELSFGPPTYTLDESFAVFVEKLILQHYNPDNVDFNNHFKLMSKNCLLSDGMSYDYYLPLEQMDFWYESLIHSLQLTNFTRSGWNVTTPVFRGSGKQPCFYTSFNYSCEEMFADNFQQTKDYYLPKKAPDQAQDDDEDKQWLKGAFGSTPSFDIFGGRRRRGLRGEEGGGEKEVEKEDDDEEEQYEESKEEETITEEEVEEENDDENELEPRITTRENRKLLLERRLRPSSSSHSRHSSSSSPPPPPSTTTTPTETTPDTSPPPPSPPLSLPVSSSNTEGSSSSSPEALNTSSSAHHHSVSYHKLLKPLSEIHNPYMRSFYIHVYDHMKAVLTAYTLRGNHTYHTTGSLHKLHQYYNTPQLIEKVTNWVSSDLREFRYPFWESRTKGMTAKDYLVALFIDMPQLFFGEEEDEASNSTTTEV